MALARELAERIKALDHGDITDDARHWAKVALLDTVGVALAGADEDCANIVARVSGVGSDGGPCQVFGKASRTSALNAALVNGTAAHALDFDDCNNTFGGHPTAPILPALFAEAEETGATGRDVLLAYITGFEAETAIAKGVHFHHYEKGWHPTATLGTFGAAAAVAKLGGYSIDETETALALCVSFAAGVKANFGTMTKPFHVGQTARAGLLAARMAREGFTANAGAFEHEHGFFEVYNGAGNYDASKVFDGWTDPLNVAVPGVAIKQHPCCGSTHPAVDALLGLVHEHGITAGDVERIDSVTHQRRLRHTNRPDPKSGLEAKFSVQYCLARALMDGRIAIEHFENGAYLDADARQIMDRVHATAHQEANHFGATVTVTTTDGRTLENRVEMAIGRGPENPLTDAQLKAKFDGCAVRALSETQAAQVYDAMQAFEDIADMTKFAGLLRPPETASGVGQAAE